MAKILIIEDEPSISDNISYALKTEGFEALSSETGLDAMQRINSEEISLIILDVGLPDVNGFDLLREVRKSSSVPVIILSARSDIVDRVVGLEIGADDYIVKPFSPRELTARVRAVLRRRPDRKIAPDAATEESKTESPFQLDEKRCLIKYHGAPLDLSRYEFRLMRVLIGNPGRVYTRDQLMARISDDPEMSLERSIDTHIKTIRQKLKLIRPEEDPIITHRGLGYSLREIR